MILDMKLAAIRWEDHRGTTNKRTSEDLPPQAKFYINEHYYIEQ